MDMKPIWDVYNAAVAKAIEDELIEVDQKQVCGYRALGPTGQTIIAAMYLELSLELEGEEVDELAQIMGRLSEISKGAVNED